MKLSTFIRGLALALLAALLAVMVFFGLIRPAESAVTVPTTPRSPTYILQSGVVSLYFPEGAVTSGLMITYDMPFPDMAYSLTVGVNSQNCEFPMDRESITLNEAGLPEIDYGKMSPQTASVLAALDSPAGPGGAYYCLEWQAQTLGAKVFP